MESQYRNDLQLQKKSERNKIIKEGHTWGCKSLTERPDVRVPKRPGVSHMAPRSSFEREISRQQRPIGVFSIAGDGAARSKPSEISLCWKSKESDESSRMERIFCWVGICTSFRSMNGWSKGSISDVTGTTLPGFISNLPQWTNAET